MNFKMKTALALLPFLALSACAETPMGPTAQVLPQPGKPYPQYLTEVNFCKDQARQSVEGQAENENHRAIIGGVITTALGAGIGAAAGGAGGAAIGAGAGALAGTGGGGLYSRSQQGGIQEQYNNAYVSCMVAYHNVPTSLMNSGIGMMPMNTGMMGYSGY